MVLRRHSDRALDQFLLSTSRDSNGKVTKSSWKKPIALTNNKKAKIASHLHGLIVLTTTTGTMITSIATNRREPNEFAAENRESTQRSTERLHSKGVLVASTSSNSGSLTSHAVTTDYSSQFTEEYFHSLAATKTEPRDVCEKPDLSGVVQGVCDPWAMHNNAKTIDKHYSMSSSSDNDSDSDSDSDAESEDNITPIPTMPSFPQRRIVPLPKLPYVDEPQKIDMHDVDEGETLVSVYDQILKDTFGSNKGTPGVDEHDDQPVMWNPDTVYTKRPSHTKRIPMNGTIDACGGGGMDVDIGMDAFMDDYESESESGSESESESESGSGNENTIISSVLSNDKETTHLVFESSESERDIESRHKSDSDGDNDSDNDSDSDSDSDSDIDNGSENENENEDEDESGSEDGSESVQQPLSPQLITSADDLPSYPTPLGKRMRFDEDGESVEVAEEPKSMNPFGMGNQKYWYQRYQLFSKYDDGVWLDREGWFSVTPEKLAKEIAQRCQHKSVKVIVDAFCGVGGNTIQFAMVADKVIAIDVNATRLECAWQNARIYGVEHKIKFILGDYMELAPTLEADVVFLSPPWGGPDYLSANVFDIKTMMVPDGYDIFSISKQITPNIAYFVPRNSNKEQLVHLAGHGFVDITHHMTGNKVKAITAFYGDLVLNPYMGALSEDATEIASVPESNTTESIKKGKKARRKARRKAVK
eukprot:CFRG2861T1